MSAGELFDYWLASQLEPWGESRADMRAAAGLAVESGQSEWQLAWPYLVTPEMVRDEFAELEAQYAGRIAELKADASSKHDRD